MPLPLTRDYDAVDTGPLPHTTVNTIQDAIVGRKHGEIKKNLSFAKHMVIDDDETNAEKDGPFVRILSSRGNFQIWMPIELENGQRLQKWAFVLEAQNPADAASDYLIQGQLWRSGNILVPPSISLYEAVPTAPLVQSTGADGDELVESDALVVTGNDEYFYWLFLNASTGAPATASEVYLKTLQLTLDKP